MHVMNSGHVVGDWLVYNCAQLVSVLNVCTTHSCISQNCTPVFPFVDHKPHILKSKLFIDSRTHCTYKSYIHCKNRCVILAKYFATTIVRDYPSLHKLM